MGARTKARRKALQLAFEADQRGVNLQQLLRDRLNAPVTETPLPERTVQLIDGVVARWSSINDALSTYSQGWTLDRMPAVDRALLRLGAYEVLYDDDIPDAVAMSEWVALARELSTDESPRFVNGLLGRLSEIKSTLA